MAADDFQISIENLHYERERLTSLVFEPLQEIKDFVARNLRSEEIARMVGFLRNVIRSDTLRTVTDGEALIAVLNLYYGKDNLRVLQRLLNKINCHDLLEILNDWDGRNNPVDTRVFRECGYFPLWIRIQNNFHWFLANKKTILKSIGRLFRIPEISPGDPDYETVIFMGVSFGKTDLLVYVLVPLCTCKYIRTSLARNSVHLALQQLDISGIYFGRKSDRNGHNDDLSATSFTSINESIQGDYLKQGEDPQKFHQSETGLGVGPYNGTHEQHQRYIHHVDSPQSNKREATEDLKVVRTSIGYIDSAPSFIKSSSLSKSVEPIRVVRPKIMYLDHSNVPAMDVEDSPKKRAALDEEENQKIVKESSDMTEQRTQIFNSKTLQGKSKAVNQGSEVEGLIVPEVKHSGKEDWTFPDELARMENYEHAGNDVNENYNPNNAKWIDYGRGDNDKHRTSVFNFSEEDSTFNNYHNDDVEKGWHPYGSPQNLPVGKLAQSCVSESASLTKPNLNPAKQSTKSDSKKLYTSTATLQINMGNKNAKYQGQQLASVNGEMYKSEAATSLNMSKPGLNGEKMSFTPSHSSPKCTQNGDSTWYKDAAFEDYYREMIPEPEPEDTQQLYQNDEFYQRKVMPEEEAATPTNRHLRAINGKAQTPLFSPPAGFRDASPTGSKLVKVTTKFFEQQPLQHPSLVTPGNEKRILYDRDGTWLETDRLSEIPRSVTDYVNRTPDNNLPHDWDSSSLEKERLRQVPRQASDSVNRSPDHSLPLYNQNRLQPVFVHPRPFLMKSESKLESDYEDSVFTDTESRGELTSSRFAAGFPPHYLSPPEYNGTARRSTGKFSDDSLSTDASDRFYKSPLLSAASVSSIYKEKEMFLSREELQMSVRGAEDKEMEKQMELCKELMIAAKAGDEEEVNRTIEEGVDINYQNEFGQSAMMVASWEGHLGIVESLLSADADPNLKEGFGKTALHEAALSGHHTIVHRLISGGAKVDQTDEEHRTPLHYAAMRGKRRIVEVLLLFGANVTLLTKYGESAVELAYAYRHDDIVVLLMSSRDRKTRKEMESQIRKQKLRQLSSAASLPNLSKVSSMKELSRSRSRPDLRKKKSVCSIQ